MAGDRGDRHLPGGHGAAVDYEPLTRKRAGATGHEAGYCCVVDSSRQALPFGITSVGDDRYAMRVRRPLCASTGSVHGGVAAAGAAAIAADVTGGTPRIIAAKYHRPCPEGSTIDLRLAKVRSGRRWTATTVTASLDGKVGFEVDVLVGGVAAGAVTSLAMPAVPPPASCPPRALKPEHEGTFPATVDWRVAAVGPGLRSAWWARPRDVASPFAQIACSDILARGTEQVLPHVRAGISLDHAFRLVGGAVDGDWCLYVVDVLAVLDDAVHGQISAWSPSGSLVGIATQTCVASVAGG